MTDHKPTEREAEAGPPARRGGATRDAEGLFVAEGEDLLAAARAAGAEPVELLTAAGRGPGRDRGRAGAARRRLLARLGHPRDRGLAGALGRRGRPRPASTCTASPTRGTSAPWSARRRRWSAAPSCSAPDCADPYGAARCGRAWARSSASRWCAAGSTTPRSRGRRWSLTAATASRRSSGAATLCLGVRARGRAGRRARRCELQVTIPLRDGRRVAERRGGGCDRDAADIVASPTRTAERGTAMAEATERIEQIEREATDAIGAASAPPSSRSCGSATWAARPS